MGVGFTGKHAAFELQPAFGGVTREFLPPRDEGGVEGSSREQDRPRERCPGLHHRNRSGAHGSDAALDVQRTAAKKLAVAFDRRKGIGHVAGADRIDVRENGQRCASFAGSVPRRGWTNPRDNVGPAQHRFLGLGGNSVLAQESAKKLRSGPFAPRAGHESGGDRIDYDQVAQEGFEQITIRKNLHRCPESTQPPPQSSPGPREARTMGRRSVTSRRDCASSAAWSAAAQVVEPRLPQRFAIGGNFREGASSWRARRSTRRGFGWCVANAATPASRKPLRSSTSPMTFFSRETAARDNASPSNCRPSEPRASSETWMAPAYWLAQPN